MQPRWVKSTLTIISQIQVIFVKRHAKFTSMVDEFLMTKNHADVRTNGQWYGRTAVQRAHLIHLKQ